MRQLLLSVLCVLITGTVQAAVIENPAPDSVHSGVFIVSGWKCEADGDITLSFNGGPDFTAVYGSDRADTFPVCDDTDNGWVLLFNYNLLPEGSNILQAYDDGVEFASVKFEVIKLNGQEFVSGASGQCSTEVADNTVQLEWQEGRQGFGVTKAIPAEGLGDCLASGGSLASTPETRTYVAGGTNRQAVDIYPIQGVSLPRPALLTLHGGYWTSGSKADVDPLQFEIAKQAGFHLISIGYRLANDPTAPWPSIIYDVKAAIRWIRQHAEELGIDPNILIISGESAGAHLAALAATSSDSTALQGPENPGFSSAVSAAILFAGPYNFRTISSQAAQSVAEGTCEADDHFFQFIWTLLECPASSDPLNIVQGCDSESVDESTPAFHLDPFDPPMFIAHGKRDCVIPWHQGEELGAAAVAADVARELHLSGTGVHDISTLGVKASDILDFIESHVRCGS